MVEGLDKLNRRWAAIPAKAQAEARKALEKNATELVAAAKSLVPVDQGALRASIDWEYAEGSDAGFSSISRRGRREYGAVAVRVTAGDATTTVTNEAGKDYQIARIQEFGTREMRANPFLFPAYRALRKRFKARVSRAIRKGIKKAK